VFALAFCACIATVQALAHPGASIRVTQDGRVFFVDTGSGVFVVGRDGRLAKHEGPAYHWFALDESSRLARTRWPYISGADITAVGRDPTLVLSSDFAVTVGRDGAFYYPKLEGGARWTIVRIDPSGTSSVYATWPVSRRSDGEPQYVNGLAASPDGALYFSHDRSIHRIDKGGRVSTFAKDVTVEDCARIPGSEAPSGPYLRGLDIAPNGTVFVAAAGCGAVVMISPKGVVTPVLRTSPPWSPTAVAIAKGEVHVLEYLHTASDNREEWLPRVRKITREGEIETIVRSGMTRR
jgi:hypothetical protein